MLTEVVASKHVPQARRLLRNLRSMLKWCAQPGRSETSGLFARPAENIPLPPSATGEVAVRVLGSSGCRAPPKARRHRPKQTALPLGINRHAKGLLAQSQPGWPEVAPARPGRPGAAGSLPGQANPRSRSRPRSRKPSG
jgi:hypothetical protein